MCDICGCGQPGEQVKILIPGKDTDKHDHIHTHAHGHHPGEHHTHGHHPGEHPTHGHHPGEHHTHGHAVTEPRRIELEQDVLGRNNLLAERNRGYFEARGILCINLVSSPGSGKTSLLEKTIRDMNQKKDFFIIEGDQQTMNDAERIRKSGVPVVQVNTGAGCHLDADMVNRAVKKLEIKENAILMIENVGNLVCPALFDLGEDRRVVIVSVTEGDDKPVKYPTMFETADLCIINKTDLLDYVDFDMEKCRQYALQVNPDIELLEMSVKTGEGLQEWYEWLKK